MSYDVMTHEVMKQWNNEYGTPNPKHQTLHLKPQALDPETLTTLCLWDV